MVDVYHCSNPLFEPSRWFGVLGKSLLWSSAAHSTRRCGMSGVDLSETVIPGKTYGHAYPQTPCDFLSPVTQVRNHCHTAVCMNMLHFSQYGNVNKTVSILCLVYLVFLFFFWKQKKAKKNIGSNVTPCHRSPKFVTVKLSWRNFFVFELVVALCLYYL